MELIRVDLTNANAYAVRLLEALGSKSIPLTALFRGRRCRPRHWCCATSTGCKAGKTMSETFTGSWPTPSRLGVRG